MQMKIPGTFPDAERFNYIVINFLLCLFLLFAHFYLTECVISIYSMNLPKLSLTPQIFPGFINLLLIYNGLLSLNTPLLKKKCGFSLCKCGFSHWVHSLMCTPQKCGFSLCMFIQHWKWKEKTLDLICNYMQSTAICWKMNLLNLYLKKRAM